MGSGWELCPVLVAECSGSVWQRLSGLRYFKSGDWGV